MKVSPNAVEKLEEIILEENEKGLGLRVAISGGGCSGFQYAIHLDRSTEDDIIIDLSESVQLMIDTISMMYLEGATLDYQDDLIGQSFVINNPNATATCGCGSSFAMG